jgi:hypothetical protein
MQPDNHQGCGAFNTSSLGTPAKLSESTPRDGPLRLAEYPPFLAAASGGYHANVRVGTIIGWKWKWMSEGIGLECKAFDSQSAV